MCTAESPCCGLVHEIVVPLPHYGCDEFHLTRDCVECFDHVVEGCEGCVAWDMFCRSWGISPLADATWSRRAWISRISTYMRGATTMLVRDGMILDIE